AARIATTWFGGASRLRRPCGRGAASGSVSCGQAVFKARPESSAIDTDNARRHIVLRYLVMRGFPVGANKMAWSVFCHIIIDRRARLGKKIECCPLPAPARAGISGR